MALAESLSESISLPFSFEPSAVRLIEPSKFAGEVPLPLIFPDKLIDEDISAKGFKSSLLTKKVVSYSISSFSRSRLIKPPKEPLSVAIPRFVLNLSGLPSYLNVSNLIIPSSGYEGISIEGNNF